MIKFENIYSMSLKDFSTAREICERVKTEQTTAFNYCISTTYEVIKYGLSNDKEWKSGTWGNRVYKQALGLPGWSNRNYNGDTSSKEMEELCNQFYPNVTKDDVIITIYDLGTPELLAFDEKTILTVLENFEDQLVDMHVNKYGHAPYGNIQKTRKRGHMQNFLNMFEAEKNEA